MTSLSIPRPVADEAAPFFERYIARVPGENIGEQLIDQLAEVDRLFGAVDDTATLARYAPGKWSVKEILGHLADVERIFSYRLLPVSAPALAYIIVGHVTHHLGVLRDRYGLGSGTATATYAENR